MADTLLSTDELTSRIREVSPLLSPQCYKVGEYLVAHPFMIALLTLHEFASVCKVPPTSVVYFATRLGFSGFSQLKLSYRSALLHELAPDLVRDVKMRSNKVGKNSSPLSRKLSDVQISYHH